MSFFEWLGRVVMLVLAGMITLSIISALAAISSQTSVPRQLGFERAQAPVPPTPEPVRPEARPEQPDTSASTDIANSVGQVIVAPAPPEPDDPSRWLEAISYALLALVGLAVLGCLLLWRLVRQQRRIADALSAGLPPSFAPPSAALRGD